MDNISHSVVGLALAQAALQGRRQIDGNLPRYAPAVMTFVSILANNVPDFDVLYSFFMGGKIGYLLHHRGHTHTLLAMLPSIGVVLGITAALARVQRWQLTRRDWVWLAGLALIGAHVHLALDYLNNYGVHPFWPWNDRWYYGDTLFIIEPWLWASVVPLLLFSVRSWLGRGVLVIVIAAAMVLPWVTGFVPWQIALAISAWAVVLTAAAWRAKEWPRITAAFLLMLAVVLGFGVAGKSVRAALAVQAREGRPERELLDLVLTPLPTNPLCWDVIEISLDREQGQYALRRGLFALWPAWLETKECYPEAFPALSAQLAQVASRDDKQLLWYGEFQADLASFAALYERSCRFRELLRFARAPFWQALDGQWLVGDLRYDRGSAVEFAELVIGDEAEACIAWEPSWAPPRRDVIEAALPRTAVAE